MLSQVVFRIEDASGNGPYMTINAARWADNPHVGSRYPEPYEDIKNIPDYWDNEYICGFESIESLYKWFSLTEIKRLYEMGFRVKKMVALSSCLGPLKLSLFQIKKFKKKKRESKRLFSDN